MRIAKRFILIALISFTPFFVLAEGIGQFRFVMPVSSSGTASTMGETDVSVNVSKTIAINQFINQTVSLAVDGAFEEEIKEDPKSSAFSLQYIMPFGLGVGITSQTIEYQVGLKTSKPTTVTGSIGGASTSYTLDTGYVSAVENIKLEFGYLDVMYVHRFLDDFSVTGGFGLPVLKATADVSISTGTNDIVSDVLDDLVQDSLDSSEAENPTALSWFVMFGYEISDFEILASYRNTSLSADYKLDGFISEFLDTDTIEWSLSVTEYIIGLGYRF
jgi:hypothetical protein